MSLPSFVGVGAQKAGTSTLHDILKQHPDICLPKEKETHFFLNGEDKFSRGIQWYEKTFFNHCKKGKLVGEITPTYMYMDYVPQRIYEELGKDVKLIFMLRDPANRAYSHYLMNRRNQVEELSFEDALAQEEERTKKDEFSKWIGSYASRGNYSEQIERFLEFFPKENMFFIIFETDFIKNKEETLNNLCDFLGVSGYNFNTDIKSNPASRTRFPLLIHLLYKDKYKFLRKPFKMLFPSQMLRNKIKNNIRNLKFNSKKLDADQKTMRINTKEKLKQSFVKETEKLQKLIKKDLSSWL